jgi:ABC-type lipoprotein release transport system permease subunit
MYGITFLGVAACICMMVFSAYFENAKKTELSSLQTQVEAKQEENKNVNDKIMNGINDFEMKSRALRLGMKVVDADNYVEYKAPENNYVKVNNNK